MNEKTNEQFKDKKTNKIRMYIGQNRISFEPKYKAVFANTSNASDWFSWSGTHVLLMSERKEMTAGNHGPTRSINMLLELKRKMFTILDFG